MTFRMPSYLLLASAFCAATLAGCSEPSQETPPIALQGAETRDLEKSEPSLAAEESSPSIEVEPPPVAVAPPDPPKPERPIPEAIEIAFVSGAVVPADQMVKLETLASRLRQDVSLSVDIVGCADPSGSKEVNLRLSEARAQSVATQLRSLGVSEEQISSVVGKGENCEVQARAAHVTPRRGGAS
jgi:outer membrane protein OmpA-like peptidoglycan-associated protein